MLRTALAGALRIGLLFMLLTPGGAFAETGSDEDESAEEVQLDEFGEPEEPQSLRERLTEREDENRVETPTVIDLFGRPLSLSGETELAFESVRRRRLGAEEQGSGETLWEMELEGELFYSLSENVYLFAQGVVGLTRAVTAPRGAGQVEDVFAERGEMWLLVRNLFDRKIHLEIGRVDFDDDRTWWWDVDLDGARVEIEGEDVDFEIAVGREIAPRSTLEDRIDPEQERVFRVLGELSWNWAEDHAVELYWLHQTDHSPTEELGRIVGAEREDPSDARLTWVGPRIAGAFETERFGLFGYWLDAAYLRGRETLLEYEERDDDQSLVVGRIDRDVRGWAIDTGVTWAMPVAFEPRITLGFAMGSGDATPDEGRERAFRQTGLHENDSAFGGVERFRHYGALLQPELSNLRVATLGLGVSILQSSSIDLVFHDYRQVEPTESLRDAALDLELSGLHEHVGSEIDLVIAIEEWESVQIQLRAAGFRAGSAVGPSRSDWSYGAAASISYAF